jgi:hypothetical protein
VPDDLLLAEVEGPKGTAEIFEVTIPQDRAIEVEYAVVFGSVRQAALSLGEAHLIANQLVGLEEQN